VSVRRPRRRLVVLGAGLSGLSVATALVREGWHGEIVLVDRRTAFGSDRTWCFWDVAPTPFTRLARHRWRSWRVVTASGEAVHRSARHPYLHLDAADVYAAALHQLDLAGAELRLGESVLGVEDLGDVVAVRTSAGELEADLVIDGLAAGSPWGVGRAAAKAPGGRHGGGGAAHAPVESGRDRSVIALDQHFLGQVVQTDRPAFAPETATLMDFRVAQPPGGVHFTYVLPFSPTEALVEDTWFGGRNPPAAERRAAIGAYLTEHAGVREWRVQREERARIPMTTRRHPLVHGDRILVVGTAAGAVRPSSGYAFLRVQRHSAALARALARGEPPPGRLSDPRHDALDRVFLRALVADPAAFPERFRALVAGTPAGTFARFMGDASSPLDELRVIAALPKLPFALAALPRRPYVPGLKTMKRIVTSTTPPIR
jgi:lycopene beta-cyclase